MKGSGALVHPWPQDADCNSDRDIWRKMHGYTVDIAKRASVLAALTGDSGAMSREGQSPPY